MVTNRGVGATIRLLWLVFSQLFTYSAYSGSLGRDLRNAEVAEVLGAALPGDSYFTNLSNLPINNLHQEQLHPLNASQEQIRMPTSAPAASAFANHRMVETDNSSQQVAITLDQMQSASVNRPQISLNIYSNGPPTQQQQQQQHPGQKQASLGSSSADQVINSMANQHHQRHHQDIQFAGNSVIQGGQNLALPSSGYENVAKTSKQQAGSFFIVPLLTSSATSGTVDTQVGGSRQRHMVSPNSRTITELNGLHYLTDPVGGQFATLIEDGSQPSGQHQANDQRSKPVLKAIIQMPTTEKGSLNDSISSSSSSSDESSSSNKNFELNMSLNGDEIIISPVGGGSAQLETSNQNKSSSHHQHIDASKKTKKKQSNNKKHVTFDSNDDQQSASEILSVDHSKADSEPDEEDSDQDQQVDRASQSESTSQPLAARLSQKSNARNKLSYEGKSNNNDSEDDGDYDRAEGSDGDEEDNGGSDTEPATDSRGGRRQNNNLQDDRAKQVDEQQDASRPVNIHNSRDRKTSTTDRWPSRNSLERPSVKLVRRDEKTTTNGVDVDQESASSIVIKGEDLRKFRQFLDSLRSLSLDNLGKPSSSSSRRATLISPRDEQELPMKQANRKTEYNNIARSRQQLQDREGSTGRSRYQQQHPANRGKSSGAQNIRAETSDCNNNGRQEQYEFDKPLVSGSSNHESTGGLETGQLELDDPGTGGRLDDHATEMWTGGGDSSSDEPTQRNQQHQLEHLMHVDADGNLQSGQELPGEGPYQPDVIFGDQTRPIYVKKMILQDYYDNDKTGREGSFGRKQAVKNGEDASGYQHQQSRQEHQNQLATASNRHNSLQKLRTPLPVNNYIDYNQLDTREVYRGSASPPTDLKVKPQSRSGRSDGVSQKDGKRVGDQIGVSSI